MKLLKCIIPPSKLDDVKEALTAIHVHGMTVSEVSGVGSRNENMNPQITIELFVPDELVRASLDAILAAARTGNCDDGKIFIMNVDQAVRIRTGESDNAAL